MPAYAATRHRNLIALTGYMGAGKTTIGRLLAEQLGWRFVDLDSLIEARAHLSIPAIFQRHGEAAFRDMEHEALERVVGEAGARGRPAVVALGGGTLTRESNRQLLRSSGAALVWLECPIEELLARLVAKSNRPLFRDEASFRALYEERLAGYQQAEYRVACDREPRRVVEEILSLRIFEQVKV